MAESWGDFADLSAPLSGPVDDDSKRLRLADLDAPEIDEEIAPLSEARYLFCEFFSGQGTLTSAMVAAGVPARSPDDLAAGGVDFEDRRAVDALGRELGELVASGVLLMVHFAPPCSTFSRARCRGSKTRLRSDERPQGLPRLMAATRSANLIACNTLYLAEWLAKELHVAVSMGNPAKSFIWEFLHFDPELAPSDVVYSCCMFGAPYQKHTRLRCWNWHPASLVNHKCTSVGEVFSCGRTFADPHVALEFGSLSTADAAAYVPELCQAWAQDVRSYFVKTPDCVDAQRAIAAVASGPVRRHVFRGATDESAKEIKKAEDQKSTAGCRNPAWLRDGWPSLWDTMAPIRSVLLRARTASSDLRGLVGCCGDSPSRSPPLEASLVAIRCELERLFVVPPGTFDWHHPASPWRAELVGTLLHHTGDPDAAVWDWLRKGAPM